MQEVYIDLYFLINLSMDFLCLTVTGALMHRRVVRWRALVGALLGAAYAVVALLLGWGGFWGFLGDLAAGLVMASVVFAGKGTRASTLVRGAVILCVCSMVLGGVMTGLYSFLNRLELPLEAIGEDGAAVWVFVLVSAIAGVVTARGGRLLGVAQKTRSVRVELTLFGKSVELCAMVDSGNLLRDPISGKSVIVVELSKLSGVLPPPLFRACEQGDYTEWLSSYERARISRPLPTQTASGESLLLALVPERLVLAVGKERYPADYLIAPCRLALADFDAVIALD